MIYLKQAQLLNPAEVEGPVEELKYPFRAAAVRYIESIVFRKPVTFLVGENGAGKSTLLEGIMFKYEERDEDSQGMLYDGKEAWKSYSNVLPQCSASSKNGNRSTIFSFGQNLSLNMQPK